MPRERRCDFCDSDIEPGTGTVFVRTDGTTIDFCSSKCEKNADLGRESRDLEWAGEEEPDVETEPEPRETDEQTDDEDVDETATEADEDEADTETVEDDDETETENAEAQT